MLCMLSVFCLISFPQNECILLCAGLVDDLTVLSTLQAGLRIYIFPVIRVCAL